MAIIFPNNKILGEVGGKIATTGMIVQTVFTSYSSAMATSSTSAVDFFTSSSITLTNASNKILIQVHSDNRSNDWGDGVWNLHYMDIVHVQSGTQLSYTGYNGEQTYTIRHVDRSVIHTPGSVGPHSYKMRGWSYQASQTTFGGGASDADATSWINLYEIAV